MKKIIKYLLLVITLTVYVIPVQANINGYVFSLEWGTEGSGNGQFSSPTGIAIDNDNNVYVVDEINNCIQKFDSNGNFLLKWGNGQFNWPEGVAVDKSGNVYVVDSGNNQIFKFDANGNFILKWGDAIQFNYPLYIAVDADNNVYVTDRDDHCIKKFDNKGTFLTRVGKEGKTDGGFYWPQGIAVDNLSNIFVADTAKESENIRIQKFNSNGGFALKWGSPYYSDGNYRLCWPTGVAVDNGGNVYVLDKGDPLIKKFDNNGNYLLTWGKRGTGKGSFDSPVGIAVDKAGNVYVTDSKNHRVQKFSVGLMSEELLSVDKIVVYPNPYKTQSGLGHNGIIFGRLPLRAKIEMFTLTGEKVREINKEDISNDDVTWDVRNEDGRNLASGIYLYLVTDDHGGKKSGKIAVIR